MDAPLSPAQAQFMARLIADGLSSDDALAADDRGGKHAGKRHAPTEPPVG